MQHELFHKYQWFILLGLVFFYSIPILSLVFYPLNRWMKFTWVHAFFGRVEWLMSFLRDGLLALLLLAFTVYLFIMSTKTGLSYFPFLILLFVGLSVWNYYFRRVKVRKFLDFIVGKYVLEPKEFFKLYFASISCLPGKLPDIPNKVIDLSLDYRGKASSVSIGPAIPGIVDTGILARFVIRASKWKGSTFSNKIADAVSTMWGARVVQLAGAALKVKGFEKLKNVTGRTIFISNHKSFVDFAVVPLIIGLANLKRKNPFRLRFLAAKEHFYDNKFLYRVLGMGKAMEKVGTIFVDRKSKKKKATEAVREAADAMVEEGVDIVMYPQGTRAHGNKDKGGRRFDAGYYTTGSEKNLLKERGHIKKGVAYLALDVAVALAKHNKSLTIVPIGLNGTGTIVPKGKIRVQRGVNLEIVIGNPIIIPLDDLEGLLESKLGPEEYGEVRGALVESLFVKIDDRLKAILRVHEKLQKRVLIDIREMMREEDIERFLEALRAWRDDEDLIFSIIDCIYSLPSRLWRSYLKRLAQLLVETDTSRDKVISFKKLVVDEMVKRR